MLKLRTLPPVLRTFALLSLILCGFAVGAPYVCGLIPRFNVLPYNGMSLGDDLTHMDVLMFPRRFDHFGTASFFDPAWGSDFLYPAPNALIYRVFHIGRIDLDVFNWVMALVFLPLGIWFFRVLMKRGVGRVDAAVFSTITVFCSYPAYFTFERSNVEVIVWGLSALGVLFSLKERFWLAAAFIGAAGACKGYPFFYLGLFLLRRKYLQIAFSIVVAAVANIVSLWAETHNIALSYRATSAGLEEFRQVYVLHRRSGEIGLDHSIFGQIKHFWPGVPAPGQLQHCLTIYLAVAAVAACGLFFLRARKLPVLNQILFITVACITLPPTSYDYTLLHLYTPWVLLVLLAIDTWQQGGELPREFYALGICFAVLLTAQNEFILHGERLEGAIKCVTLLVTAGLSLYVPLSGKTPQHSADSSRHASAREFFAPRSETAAVSHG